MDNQQQKNLVIVLLLVIGTLSCVDSYRADFIPSIPSRQPPAHVIQQQQQQGCVWSTLSNNNNNVKNESTTTIYPPFLRSRANTALDCNVRTLDFWSNYAFSEDQLESTSHLNVKCNDKLFFESSLDPSQSYFRLRNLQDVSIHSCKIRKIPTRIWTSLGFLKSLTISSLNGEWSSAVGMDIEMGAFEGLSNLEKLDLSQSNIWAIQDKNVFCPLRSLLKLNMSRNRLSDLEEVGFGSSSTFRLSSSDENGSTGSCNMNIQNLDLSHNALRRLSPNAFNRLRKLSELRLQNNLIEEINDFQGLTQLRLVNISGNRLVALPPTIFKDNQKLREINLSNNSISALTPEVFSGLTSLISLDLSHNILTSQWVAGDMFPLPRLINLRLSYNKLSYIDSSIFKNLVNLQVLHLDNQNIEAINPSAFQHLKSLIFLDLSRNKLALIDSRLFSNQFKLRQLYLDYNKIQEIEPLSLKNTSLEDLGLSGNLLPEVPVALQGLNHLVTLDLGENKIESLRSLKNAGLDQLYGLRLVDNKITELPNLCESMKNLRVLNIAQNKIAALSQEFDSCPELRVLRLDTNALEMLPNLTKLPSLLWLNVSSNRLKWADYKLLPPTVEWLDLSNNEIETYFGMTDGGKYSLRILDVSYNKLRNLDYTIMAPTLETLRVNYNELRTISPDTFIRATRLRRLELIGNQLENLSLDSIRFPQIPKDRSLPEMYIGGNPFVCDCSMEWLTRVNQLSVLRIHPRIVDLNNIVCQPTFTRPNQLVPLIETRPKDFLCPYKSHCFALCNCCEYDACDCEMSCPDNCSCFRDSAWSANIVKCSSNFTEVPSRIPMDATEIFLDGNKLELRSHVFLGKKNLRSLYLNGSQIETIKNKTFNGLKSLEILRLDDNLLEEIHGWEFADLAGSLRELYLQNNRLRYVNPNTFSPLIFLTVLRLDGNFLFDFNVWELSGNGYLNSLMISNNPWSCDCEFLIPLRAFAAAKTAIVVDFPLTKCQPAANELPTTVGSNSTDSSSYNDQNNVQQQQHQQPQLIINMCDHNKELNFNFNPNNNNDNFPALLDSELLNSNRISAEKVASSPPSSSDMNILMGTINSGNNNNIPHHNNNYPSINDISAAQETIESNEGWTIFTSVLITLVVVALVIAVLFRHSLLPFWMYSWLNSVCCYCGGAEEEDNEEGATHRHRGDCFFSSLFSCCCGGASGEVGKKSRTNLGGMDDTDKLFDAYFLYSRKDEDLLVQKLAPELESPPPHHAGNSCYYRLCLHYRDLCLSAENPLNTDMVLSACEASKRIVLVISRSFLQNELSHPGFRSTIQTAINRYQNKLIFIVLQPLTEQNLLTIYPELKAGHFTTMTMTKAEAPSNSNSCSSQITSLEWSDKNFWSKLKFHLPTPNSSTSPSGLNSTSTISSTGSSAIFNMTPAYHHPHHHSNLINYNNAHILQEYAYNTINSQHQYHRNILPFQQLGGVHNGNTPPVPKHHIALSTPSWQQQQLQNQNFYNNSQHSQIVPIPGYPATTTAVACANTPLMVPNSYHHHQQQQQPNVPSFNESFRRHLQLQQNQNKTIMGGGGGGGGIPPAHHHQHHLSSCSSSSQGHLGHAHHHHHHQGSHCSSSHSSSTSNNNPSILPYQPLDANYSSSGSNEELLDHVYSTLDSPPIMTGPGNNNNNHHHHHHQHGCESNSELINKQINSGSCIDEQDNNNTNNENSRVPPPPSQQLQQNRLNNNNNNTNCPVVNNNNSGTHDPTSSNNSPAPGTNNNGTMYFV